MISDLLNFSIPAFTRLTWVSLSAKEVWLPRLLRIVDAWSHIEWATVVNGVRACAITTISIDELSKVSNQWLREGIVFLPLSNTNHTNPFLGQNEQGNKSCLQLVVGKINALQDFQVGLEHDDHNVIGRLLNYPDCCQHFLREIWESHRIRDATWPIAIATDSSTQKMLSATVEVSGPPQANILWRVLNISSVCHLPCCFNCSKTVDTANHLISTGRDAGYTEEMDWLLELLSWPVEWSALHGIAEIKTPILRICTSTDATGSKYTIRYQGENYPQEGARALNFPYQMPHSRRVTQSRGYQNGLDNPIAVLPMIN